MIKKQTQKPPPFPQFSLQATVVLTIPTSLAAVYFHFLLHFFVVFISLGMLVRLLLPTISNNEAMLCVHMNMHNALMLCYECERERERKRRTYVGCSVLVNGKLLLFVFYIC